MKPIEFKQQNVTYTDRQKIYLPLPAHETKDGIVISCWYMSFFERVKILFTGRLYVSIITFNKQIQPIRLQVSSMFQKK
jgi:hypothetical protein